MDKMMVAVDAANERAWDSSILDPQSALEDAQEALDAAKAIDYAKGQADATLNIGWATFYLSRLSDAYDAFRSAHNLYEKIGDTVGICKTLNAFGIYHNSIFRLDKAIDDYTRSLELARANGFLERELIAMANIGELCLDMGNPQGALEYLMPAYDKMTEEFSSGIKADCLRNIGQAFLAMDNLKLAAVFTQKSYELVSASGELIMATDSIETLANVALAEGDPEKAEALISEGLDIVDRTGNLSQRASLLIVRGQSLYMNHRTREALDVLTYAERICEQINLKIKLFKVQEQISKAYEAMGDYEKALLYFKRFASFKAELQSEDTANKLRSMRAQAEIERTQQESEIYRLRNIDLKEKTEALEDINRQITSISTIGRRITANLDFNTLVQTVHDCLKPFLEMDLFGIALHDPAKNQLVYKWFYEEGNRKSNHRIPVDSESSFAAWAYRNRKPVLVANKDIEFSRYLSKPSLTHGKPAQSIVCIPLSIEDRSIGVMTVQNYKAHAYTDSHLSFLTSLGPYVSIAMENAIIHDSLEDLNRALSDEKRRLERATLKISHLANHDSLTGLPNRRLLFELMEKAIETTRRAGGKIGVVFIDLDDFKPINDRFGHAAGDSALIAMAERLRSLVRASDIVARIGGDEFVAVITNVKTMEDIERVARKVMDECHTPLAFAGKSCQLGMSMGISVFPDDAETIEELVNKADSAMYRVKHIDKNAYAFSTNIKIDALPLD